MKFIYEIVISSIKMTSKLFQKN